MGQPWAGIIQLALIALMGVGVVTVLRKLLRAGARASIARAGPAPSPVPDAEYARLMWINEQFHGELETARQRIATLAAERDGAEAARAALAARCRALEAAPRPAQADDAELSRLRARVTELGAEVAALRADLADTAPDDVWRQRFRRAKLHFATTFHPDNTRGKPDADAREVAFKLFWSDLKSIARER